jgi:hypothetical protein
VPPAASTAQLPLDVGRIEQSEAEVADSFDPSPREIATGDRDEREMK